jgi:hypothetical protein
MRPEETAIMSAVGTDLLVEESGNAAEERDMVAMQALR